MLYCTLFAVLVLKHTLQYASEHPSFGANKFEAARYPCDLRHTRFCNSHSEEVHEHSNEFQAQLREPVSSTDVTSHCQCTLVLLS
jgi:hypothetical protein